MRNWRERRGEDVVLIGPDWLSAGLTKTMLEAQLEAQLFLGASSTTYATGRGGTKATLFEGSVEEGCHLAASHGFVWTESIVEWWVAAECDLGRRQLVDIGLEWRPVVISK